MGNTICSSCNNIHDTREKCPCRIARAKERNREKNEHDIEASKFYKSIAWRERFRPVIIKRDNGHCQRCLIKYGIIETKNLQVHHIKPRSKYPKLKLEKTNCITLCRTCNTQLGIQEQLDFIATTLNVERNLSL